MMLMETLTLTVAMNFSVADDDVDDVDDNDFFDTIDGDRASEVCIKFSWIFSYNGAVDILW